MSELLKRNFGRVRELAVGPESPPIASRAGLLGSIVCNEAMYPEDARERVTAGAEVLANLSNDSYVPGNEFAENQLRIAVLRAIEQRRYLVRASTSGPSAIVEPSGRVAARSAPHSVAVLRGHIAPSRATTLYARIGDAFAWLCLFAAAAAALATLRTPSRRRVTPSANASARA
jgi:apolipoprotein N-acyltransferase